MAPYRPPGRSNRSGRTQADNDVFEGLPVKQWTHAPTRVSLVPPASEVPGEQGQDKWAEPPMPRDYQLLQPWTQHLLKLARSGKLGQKRKPTRDADDADGEDYGAREDDANGGDESNGLGKGSMLGEDRAFVAKKWRHVPEHALVPEHLHLEYLARSRKGLPSFYHNLNGDGFLAPVPMRKTKVLKVLDATTGEVAVYEILVPEGQPLENEVVEGSEFAEKEPTVLTVGTFVEGLGTANPDGVLVAEVRNAAAVAQRRNRPPPKKKGGPGRGKKRVTFTNPDGSTYTTIVPNATKIVPQPGQTVKHVAKGEEAARDITAEEAASMKAAGGTEGDDDDEEDGDEEDGDEGDDREDGEVEESAENDTKPGTPQVDAPEVEKPAETLETETVIGNISTAEPELDAATTGEDADAAPTQQDVEMIQTDGTSNVQPVAETTETYDPMPPAEDVPAVVEQTVDTEMLDAGADVLPVEAPLEEQIPAPEPTPALASEEMLVSAGDAEAAAAVAATTDPDTAEAESLPAAVEEKSEKKLEEQTADEP